MRGRTKLGLEDIILSGKPASQALELGAVFGNSGKGAILAHDFPDRVAKGLKYSPTLRPVREASPIEQGLAPAFEDFMRGFKGFVGRSG